MKSNTCSLTVGAKNVTTVNTMALFSQLSHCYCSLVTKMVRV